ncbi:hypothetical protein ICR95_22270 [Priestia megaterium]|uniref:hypothetical protein n=1 Tax=Priestia megaterium TaxID=1404 RepID=UPI00196AC7AA|nr:hypothetical protein [Priestia megaterium]QSF32764.1 hypothetical protein ICR95_22270 [Priestia megaterium]
MTIIASGTMTLTDLNDAIIAGTAPSNPAVNTLWIDTSITPNMLKKWSGSAWINVGELDPDYSDTIENINKSIDDITSDSVIDYTERKILKDRITKIIGYVIADNATTLPAVSTLDSSGKGEFYTVRKQALNAGIPSPDATYTAVATQYTNLKTYLESLTPVDVWDLSTANKSKTIPVTKSTFRDKFLQYDNAVNALVAATAAKQKSNSDAADQKGQSALDDLGLNSEKWSDAANKVGLWKYKGDENKFNGNVVATRTLFATALLLSDWTNLIENPDFEEDTIGSIPAGFNSTTGVRVADISGFTNGNGSNKALEIDAYATSNNSIYVSNLIPVKEGEVFFLAAEGRYLNTAGSGTGRLGFLRYDGKKQSLNSWQTPITWSGTKNTTFTDMSATYTVPAGTGYLQVYATFSNNGETTNKFYIDNLRMRRMANAELIVDGIIEGRHIKAGSVEFGVLSGGIAKFGGSGNGNGKVEVYNENDELIASLDASQGGFSDLYVGNFESPTVVEYSADDINLFVSDRLLEYAGAIEPNDDNEGTGWTKPLSTVTEAIRRIPKYYDGKATINVAYNSLMYESFEISGFLGAGSINLSLGSSKFYGNPVIKNNLLNIFSTGGTINGKKLDYAVVSLLRNAYVRLEKMKVYGNGSSMNFDTTAGFTEMDQCETYGADLGISSRYGGRVFLTNCKGSATTYGLHCYGGDIFGQGTAPSGGNNNIGEVAGGKVMGSFTYGTTTGGTMDAQPTTVTINASSGDSWRDNFGGQWYGQNEVVQGKWGSYGIYRGLWFFSLPSLSGKTITQIRMFVHRKKAGGNAAPVTTYFKPHTYTSKPSGAPSHQSPQTTASFKPNEGKWITIPSSFYAGFVSGSYKGIGIYINSTNQNYYAKFDATAKLEITYK